MRILVTGSVCTGDDRAVREWHRVIVFGREPQ